MIAVDTNLLVHAHRRDTVWHDRAREAVRGLAEASVPWAIPWPCVHEFLAVVTHPRIFAPPTPPALAFDQVEAWLGSPSLVLLGEGPTHLASLKALVLASRVEGPKVHDARVAALCVQHGVAELWTLDRDFSAFVGVRVRNPLVG